MGNISSTEALERMIAGNKRFATNVRSVESLLSQMKRGDLVAGQSPIAVVLSCSDSRAPAEMVFDQGLGDLFVIRVAGNVVAPSQIGSVEFAVERFGTTLVAIVGHTGCGAIDAAIASAQGQQPPSRGLRSIVDRVRPSIDVLVDAGVKDPETLRTQAVRANVRNSVDHLRHGSAIVEEAVLKNGLKIVGGVFDLATGIVDFFDDNRS